MVGAHAGHQDDSDLERLGPYLRAKVGSYGQFGPTNNGPLHLALVDTGATHTNIDVVLATSLKLHICGHIPAAGAQGEYIAPLFWGQVYIPALGLMMKGAFQGVDLTGQPCDLLLGRTLLRYFRMTYNGPLGEVHLRRALAQPSRSSLEIHTHEFYLLPPPN